MKTIVYAAATRIAFGPPPSLRYLAIQGTVTELWLIAAVIVSGVVIGTLILAALKIADSERDRPQGRDDLQRCGQTRRYGG